MKTLSIIFILAVFTTTQMKAQQSEKSESMNNDLKTYVIEREIPGAGQLTPEELKNISQASCSVLSEMGPSIEWQHSYVTGDKVYCVYKAENKELVEEHARKGGFPANMISEVATTISPATAKN